MTQCSGVTVRNARCARTNGTAPAGAWYCHAHRNQVTRSSWWRRIFNKEQP